MEANLAVVFPVVVGAGAEACIRRERKIAPRERKMSQEKNFLGQSHEAEKSERRRILFKERLRPLLYKV